MFDHYLAQYIHISSKEVDRLLKMNPHDIYYDAVYQDLLAEVAELDIGAHLPEARAVLEAQLPRVVNEALARYNLQETAMSPYTLGNWLVGFVSYPDELPRLLEIHDRFPSSMMREALPHIIDMFAAMPNGGHEWQRAMAVVAIPLAAY